jgi:DNA-binding NtrC family response regulator
MFGHVTEGDGKSLSAPVMRLLVAYTWPGNIRELKNLIERYVLFGSEDAICAELQATTPSNSRGEAPVAGQISLKKLTKNAVREFERQFIFQALKANDWNRKRAARALSISYRALLYKLKDAGVTPPTSSGQWQRHAASETEQTRAATSHD